MSSICRGRRGRLRGRFGVWGGGLWRRAARRTCPSTARTHVRLRDERVDTQQVVSLPVILVAVGIQELLRQVEQAQVEDGEEAGAHHCEDEGRAVREGHQRVHLEHRVNENLDDVRVGEEHRALEFVAK